MSTPAGDVGVAQLLAARRGLQDWITHSLSAAAAAAAPAPASREDGTARYDTADDGGKRGGCGTAPSAVDAAVGAVGLGPLLAAATLLEELLPAVAPGLVPGGAAAGVRNAARLHVQVRLREFHFLFCGRVAGSDSMTRFLHM